jgi:cytochrome oxidase Cu insertion factor (SCO1/SenC/PrrC family)
MVVFSKRMARLLAASALFLAPVVASAQNDSVPLPTGPAVGEKIPAFEAVDQSGRRQTFESLKGPNGLLLLFYRSADW